MTDADTTTMQIVVKKEPDDDYMILGKPFQVSCERQNLSGFGQTELEAWEDFFEALKSLRQWFTEETKKTLSPRLWRQKNLLDSYSRVEISRMPA